MKQLGLFVLCILFSCFAKAENPAIPVESKIERVTVFLNGAQVTRTASTAVSSGTTILRFEDISPEIDKQSIQVKGDGEFTILSVVHELNFLKEQEKKEQLVALENRQKEVRHQIQLEEKMISVYQKEQEMIMANKSIGGQNNGVKINELKAAADFYRSRLKEIQLEQLAIGQRKDSLNQLIAKLDQQLREWRSKRNLATSEILVSVNAGQEVKAKFEISYLVSEAGWYPTYDIRVKDVSSPLDLTYKANVRQLSGEDWNEVKLTISSGDPDKSGNKPELSPWKLSFNQRFANQSASYLGTPNEISGRITDAYGEGLIAASILVKGTTIGTITDLDGNFSINLPKDAKQLEVSYIGYESQSVNIGNQDYLAITLNEGLALDEVVVTGYASASYGVTRKKKEKDQSKSLIVTEVLNTTSVEFEIEPPYSILNDGKQYTVDMITYELPAYFEYYCVPKLDTDAFLNARLTGWDDYNLLAGEANLYFEGKFLGKTLMDVSVVSDTLDLSLGRDKNIVVTRTNLKEFSKKKILGSKKKETRAWEIEVRNKKQEDINIVITDQVPISTSNEIIVENKEYKEAQFDEETGELVWKFKLSPSATKTIGFKYDVRYPKNRTLYLD